jgi:predicted ATP-dependent protease
MTYDSRLDASQLRHVCDPAVFSFVSTAELPPLERVLGQERAVQSIDFGVDMPSYGYNIFVMGPAGSGRTTAVRQFLDQRAAARPAPHEWCYVYNFEDARRPRAVSVTPGRAVVLRRQMEALVQQLQVEIPRAFEGQPFEERRRELILALQAKQQALFQNLDSYLKARGFALIRSESGLAIAPMGADGEALSAEAYQKLSPEEKKRYEAYRAELQGEFDQAMREARELDRQGKSAIEGMTNELASFVVDGLVSETRERFLDCPKVLDYIEAVRRDVVANVQQFLPSAEENIPFALRGASDGARWLSRYVINVLAETAACACAPVVIEDNPTYPNLVGRIEHRAEFGAMVTDFTQIRAGALHRANGGYLVVEAKNILANALAWDALKRALHNREIRIEEMAPFYGLVAAATLDPEPIPLELKVVIIGDARLYGLLYAYDEDFRDLFKVKAEFTQTMPRDTVTEQEHAQFVGNICRHEGLRHFTPDAVARLVDESSRMADNQGKLSTRFASVADLVRESAFWAGRAGRELVIGEDVQRAVGERIARLDRVVEQYTESVLDGVILIDTEGAAVGQVNGLSVAQSGDFVFGLPSRITARTFLGRAAVVSIEREVRMSGPIHDKGQLILTGYLSSRFAQKHPLSMSASLTFEQLYSGVEGDSASSTELYALLSSLADVAIKQCLAVTGSVNQFGQVQAIGGANHKIEGFYDICKSRGLTGDQGVLIPASNARHLMLREDVVDAVARGQFHIHAVYTIKEGIELLTGISAGEPNEEGDYPEDTVYGRVQAKLSRYAERMKQEPERSAAEKKEPPEEPQTDEKAPPEPEESRQG